MLVKVSFHTYKRGKSRKLYYRDKNINEGLRRPKELEKVTRIIEAEEYKGYYYGFLQDIWIVGYDHYFRPAVVFHKNRDVFGLVNNPKEYIKNFCLQPWVLENGVYTLRQEGMVITFTSHQKVTYV